MPGKKEKYTILVLAGDAGAPKRFEVSRRALRGLAIIAGLAAIGLGVGLVDYVHMKMTLMVHARASRDLRRQIAEERQNAEVKRNQLSSLRDEVLQLRNAISATSKLDRDLRREQGLPSPAEPLIAAGGVDVKVPLTDRFDSDDVQRLHKSVRELIERAGIRKTSLASLKKYFTSRRAAIAQEPSIWPVKGWVTSDFGVRPSPFTGEPAMHEGVDISAPIGTVIVAPSGGVVSFVGLAEGFGNYLVIDHGGGVTTHYGHLASSLASEGTAVHTGMPIALVGNTGRSTGPHLHYEVRIMDIPVNPQPYLPSDPEMGTDLAQGP